MVLHICMRYTLKIWFNSYQNQRWFYPWFVVNIGASCSMQTPVRHHNIRQFVPLIRGLLPLCSQVTTAWLKYPSTSNIQYNVAMDIHWCSLIDCFAWCTFYTFEKIYIVMLCMHVYMGIISLFLSLEFEGLIYFPVLYGTARHTILCCCLYIFMLCYGDLIPKYSIFQTGISNCIPQYSVIWNYLSLPEILASRE